jgi:hypothetical protein
MRILLIVSDITGEFVLELDFQRREWTLDAMCYDGVRKTCSQISAYNSGVKTVAAYLQPQEQATGVLTVRCHRLSPKRVSTEDCQEGGRLTHLEDSR